jgi:hypothetical protein
MTEKYKAFRATGLQISKEKIAERAGCSGGGWNILSYGYDNAGQYTYIRAERKQGM